ncbi:B3/4 domain-containing protein [Dysgonomonas sp. 520]|uniref:B3/B4 domain-containing protein n=1 Tax=Dysgonomonas sp. 520 TaxID=2302931 RepID=UPI0013D44928|nr:phenylalanine--tRNA ligase beta subunit-related protein [Dysgonomonas sp. 520]NDW08205.1 hypothetical protein [Dysgonomonas sp. 520]
MEKVFNIQVADEIKNACPRFVGAAILADVQNSTHNNGLWEKINTFIKEYKIHNPHIEDIKKNAPITATREAYKKLGKDPNRYRPSAESLRRRILRDLPLYQVDTLVDLINLVSMSTGYSIGGFDADKIAGNNIVLGVGQKDEPYEAIGRGMLNIEGLPVYRDNAGGIGTPTSDNERTKIEPGTSHLLAIVNGYSGKDGLSEAVDFMQDLLREFASAENLNVTYF